MNSNLYDTHEKLCSTHSEGFQICLFQSSQTPDAFVNAFRPGGNLTLICDSWATRVIEGGADPYGLGRWSYLTLQGKNDKKITIMMAYRVSTDLAGPMTSTMQQYRKMSNSTETKDYEVQPQPRCQFLLDLQAWLEKMKLDNCEIILALDANKEFNDEDGSIIPLCYAEGNHIKHSTHDGTISMLCKSCGLVDPMTWLHMYSKPPPTYNRGKSRLDYIFIFRSLLHAINRAGILPYNSMFLGDHRPKYIDFSSNQLFQESTHPIAPLSRRALQIFDPRKVDKYLDHFHQQLIYQKVQEKVSHLKEIASTNQWTAQQMQQYEQLDTLSLILIPRLQPCSGRLKGEAMIYLLTGTVRIKARAETDSGRFTKHYVYTVLSRVYNFYKSQKVMIFLSKTC
jgi:hypothetical protein